MSIGLKGLNNLQNQINRLEAKINNCCPGEDPESSICVYKSCTPGCKAPEGYPVDLKFINMDPINWGWESCEENIKVYFEWFPEGVEEPHLWCCCYTADGTAVEGEQTGNILSVEKGIECDNEECEGCNG